MIAEELVQMIGTSINLHSIVWRWEIRPQWKCLSSIDILVGCFTSNTPWKIGENSVVSDKGFLTSQIFKIFENKYTSMYDPTIKLLER